MTTEITEQEIEAIDKILEMYMDDEEKHYWEWSMYGDTNPLPLEMDEIVDHDHIYYSLRVLQEMVDKLKTKR